MTDNDNNDAWSPWTMRIILGFFAAGLIGLIFIKDMPIGSWPWWLCLTLAVILLCAAITPPFRRPRG